MSIPMNNILKQEFLVTKEIAQTNHVIEYIGKPVKDIKKAFLNQAKKQVMNG